MPRRRLLLALALAVALGALAATVVGMPRGRGGATDDRGASRPPPPPAELGLRVGRRPPQRVTARVGTHVVFRVAVPAPGEVDLDKLGLVDSATPRTPATFDLLLERPGSYEATFRPVGGRSQPAGTLVVRPR